jgi:uroporphyrin-III C-methyltransferase/precorrin-2 dehydrogenase/sirohydrochlorin ferrochelatase
MLEDWPALARAKQTLAFYMPVSQLDWLATQLMTHGRSGDTPYVIVENGTRPEQRVIHGRLDTLAQAAAAHAVKSPSLLLVGEVTGLAPNLQWFGARIDTHAGIGMDIAA